MLLLRWGVVLNLAWASKRDANSGPVLLMRRLPRMREGCRIRDFSVRTRKDAKQNWPWIKRPTAGYVYWVIARREKRRKGQETKKIFFYGLVQIFLPSLFWPGHLCIAAGKADFFIMSCPLLGYCRSINNVRTLDFRNETFLFLSSNQRMQISCVLTFFSFRQTNFSFLWARLCRLSVTRKCDQIP